MSEVFLVDYSDTRKGWCVFRNMSPLFMEYWSGPYIDKAFAESVARLAGQEVEQWGERLKSTIEGGGE